MTKCLGAAKLAHGEAGTDLAVDPERYGDLTDEFEQMYSAEQLPRNGSVIIAGDIDDLLIEMVRYLVSPN